jgi:hypothetical protein
VTRNRFIQSLLSVGAVLAGCQSGDLPTVGSGDSEPTVPDAPEIPLVVQPPQEIRGTERDPQLAFRARQGAFEAEYRNHSVAITNGRVAMTPRVDAKIAAETIRFATTAVSRDAHIIATAARGAKIAANGEVHIDRGAVLETIENREEGVEQRWDFASAPAGEGDLVVEVDVTGQATVSSTSNGLHFLGASGYGVRYSHARWLDSAGEVWDIPSVWQDDRIVLRVPADLLEVTVFPATLDPTVEAEEGVDEIIDGFSGSNASTPAIASRGSGFLVTWADDRANRQSDIYATRLGADGTVFDRRGLVINAAAGVQTTPVVARVSGRYLLAWRNGDDIAAATITDANAVAQLGAVAATAAVDQLPSIAAQGNSAVLAWQSGSDIQAAYFNGTSFAPPFAIAATTSMETDPAVAASPSGFLVVYGDSTGLKGQLLTTAGAISGAAFTVTTNPTTAGEPAVTFNGTDYVVTFNFFSDVYGTRVSTVGAVLDAVPVPIGIGTGAQASSVVSCDAASCLVSWMDTRAFATTGFDVYAQRFDFALAPIGAEFPVQAASRYQLSPVLARGNSGWIGVWEDQQTGGTTFAMSTPISAAGVVTAPAGVPINLNYNNEQDASISSSPSQQLIIWSDSRTVGNDIRGIRVNGVGGARLDANAVPLTTASGDQSSNSVSFDGANYLAVWSDARGATRDIYATRFSTAGVTLDSAGIAVTTAAGDQLVPDVASGGGVSLAVWQDRRNGEFDIYGALLSQSGVVTVADITISTAVDEQNQPSVTYDGVSNQFVVVWSDSRSGAADIYGTRISVAGAVLDPAGIQLTGAANAQVTPDIARSGSGLVAVWDDRRTDAVGDIYGTRLTAGSALTVLDPAGIAINTVAGRQNSPTIVGLSNGHAVAWVDQRTGGTTGSDIYGEQLSSLGQPATATGFVIDASTGSEGSPRLQNDLNTSDRAVLVYQSFRTNVSTTRVFRRSLLFTNSGGPNGLVCKSNSQCASGFCVDGFCCNSACGGSANLTDCQTCSIARGGTVNGTCTAVVTEQICRNYGDLRCDAREYCDGVNLSCPPDLGSGYAGFSCTLAGGGTGVCPSDAAPGPHLCQ